MKNLRCILERTMNAENGRNLTVIYMDSCKYYLTTFTYELN